MKKFQILKSLCFVFILVLCGCSGSDESGGDGDVDPGGVVGISIEVASETDCGIYAGDAVSFIVKGDSNEDLTNSSSISVNGNTISGNTYTATESGALQVVATHNSLTSNSLQLTIAEDVVRFVKNVLVEDYTGTWCGYCPRVSHAIDLTKQQTGQVAVIAVHNDAEFYCDEVAEMESAFGISGYPTAKIDRGSDWTFPEPNNINQIVNKTLCDNSEVGIALIPTLEGNTMTIEVKAKFGNDFTFNNSKLVVMVLEDGLIADQENYTSYYGGAAVLPNFEHNHVLRSSLTNVTGDPLSSDELVGSVYKRVFSVNVPANVADTANMSIVAFITNDNFTGQSETINVRTAHFDEVQDFQENN